MAIDTNGGVSYVDTECSVCKGTGTLAYHTEFCLIGNCCSGKCPKYKSCTSCGGKGKSLKYVGLYFDDDC